MVNRATAQETAPTEPTSPHDPETAQSAEAAPIPEKFQNPDGTLNTDALLKSYQHMESKQGSGEGQPTPAAEDAPEDAPEAAPEAAPGDISTPFDYGAAEGGVLGEAAMARYQAEYNASDSGELSAEAYAALEAGGVPRQMVDAHIAMLQSKVQADAEAFEAEVMEATPGTDWSEMMQWAGEALSDSEKDAFNTATGSGDIERAKAAAIGLADRYRRETTQLPKGAITSTTPPGAPTDVYRDWGEFVKDTRDPRYRGNPNSAFVAEVNSKFARSNL